MHGAWKDSRDLGSNSASDRLYDLDESHLEASSIRKEEWIIRGPQTNQSLGSGSQERLLEFSSWALP